MSPSLLSKQEQLEVSNYLEQNLAGPVAIEVWTRKESGLVLPDRDSCLHCDDVIAVARQIATLHPGLSLTLYDLDRHAARGEAAGIERHPTTVFRGRGGREFRIVGLWSGLLFPPAVDALVLLSSGATPLSEDTKQILAGIEEDVPLEVMGAPYDAFSAHMLRLAAAFAVESKRLHATFTQIAEFPMLASTRGVDEIPVLLLGSRRYVGTWDGPDLAEQIRLQLAGESTVVERANPYSGPYYSEEELNRLAMEHAAHTEDLPQTESGLYLPS